MAKNTQTHYGVYEKDGDTRTVYSVADRVRLEWEGWAEKKEPTADARAEMEEAQAAPVDRNTGNKGK